MTIDQIIHLVNFEMWLFTKNEEWDSENLRRMLNVLTAAIWERKVIHGR